MYLQCTYGVKMKSIRELMNEAGKAKSDELYNKAKNLSKQTTSEASAHALTQAEAQASVQASAHTEAVACPTCGCTCRTSIYKNIVDTSSSATQTTTNNDVQQQLLLHFGPNTGDYLIIQLKLRDVFNKFRKDVHANSPGCVWVDEKTRRIAIHKSNINKTLFNIIANDKLECKPSNSIASLTYDDWLEQLTSSENL